MAMAGLFKRFRQRFGIAAPRMTVRTHLPWYWRWLGIIFIASVSLALADWMYDAGRRFAGFDSSEVKEELTQLRSAVSRLELEAAQLRSQVDAADAKVKIEQSAQLQLAAQLKQFEQENTRLKEDLAFFEGLGPSGQRDERVSIHRFTLLPGSAANEFRYRMLVLQGGKRDQAFQGRVQLLGDLQDKGRNAMIPLAGEGIGESGMRPLSFRFFSRIEGTFRVQPGTRIKAVQARVFENGSAEAKAVQVANIP